MRLLLSGIVLSALLACAYVAMPFHAAWSLREAVRTGDSAYLARKVEWDSVRSTLKASLVKHARLMPEIDPNADVVNKPGLWQRVKLAFGQSMIDNFVERYMTPEGLPKLFEYRRTFNTTVRREPETPEADLTRLERFQRFWARLKRAEFMSATRIEIEMEDRRQPGRRFVSEFQLRDLEWRLTGLRVTAAPVGDLGPLPLDEARLLSEGK